jgi:hypothetical protein
MDSSTTASPSAGHSLLDLVLVWSGTVLGHLMAEPLQWWVLLATLIYTVLKTALLVLDRFKKEK